MQSDQQQWAAQRQPQPSYTRAALQQPKMLKQNPSHKGQQHASSSDEDDGSSLSGSSNCSSGPGGSDDEPLRASRMEQTSGSFPPSTSGAAMPGGTSSALTSVRRTRKFLRYNGATSTTRSEERHNKRVTRVYMKAVRLLTKMCMILEDDNVIVCKPDAPAAKKLGKFMVRYDRLLGRLEALATRRGHLASATVPGGLLKALDDDADPYEWIEDCVLTPHRRENDRARGFLHALGSYQASILHVLRWGHLEEPLPPIHRLKPHHQQTEHQQPAHRISQKPQHCADFLPGVQRPVETPPENMAVSQPTYAPQVHQMLQQQTGQAPRTVHRQLPQ